MTAGSGPGALPSPFCQAPAGPLRQLESRGTAETFLAMLEQSGLRGELEASNEPYTLLAPEDRAFVGVAPETVARLFDPRSRDVLRDLLGDHILPGRVSARDAALAGSATSSTGSPLACEFVNGQLRIGGAPVVGQDLSTEGGALHELSAVILLRPWILEPTPARRVAAQGLAASERAGLDPLAQRSVLEVTLAAAAELEPEGVWSVTLDAGFDERQKAAALRTAILRGLGRTEPTALSGASVPALNKIDPMKDAKLLARFDGSEGDPDWYTLNDDVMGGISRSRFQLAEAEGGDPARGVFQGALSLENNGGFASIRSSLQNFDLEGFKGLRIQVKTDGREYGVSAVCADDQGRTGSWRKRFTVPAGAWTTVDIPFEEMVLNIRGRQLPEVGPPAAEAIQGFSFIIGDKNTDPFRLEIGAIGAYF
ncbi:CIA30 family protein [Saltatorellus ferox]